jgi:hypothetical protein
VARVETVLVIVIIVLGVGGWLVIHRQMRRQLRAEAAEAKASEAKRKKKARR